ncbi:MAG: cyclic nucleotide-binding domain-containing protein [Rhizobiaceae bacterium]|nr:cyclic nucleotide-binding domain-containing protein [Rhizobiaceae bacterium]
MALDDDIRVLSTVRLFEGFTNEQLRLLAFGAEALDIPAGEIIYREGEVAETAYVVITGRVRIFRERDGEVVSLGAVGPGTMLGEIGLIAETARLTSAAAETEVHTVRLSRKMFRRILEEYPELAALLHTRIAADLHQLVNRISLLAPRFAS